MTFQIVGAVIGMFWGWPFAILGFGIGSLLSAAFTQEDAGSGEYVNNHFNQHDNRPDGWTDDLFDHHSLGINGISDNVSGVDCMDNHGCDINPANGLPMIGGSGGVDVEGNPYGTDFSHDDHFSGFSSGGGIGSGFDDNW